MWIPSTIVWRTTQATKIATTATKSKHNQRSLKEVDDTFPIGVSKNVEMTSNFFKRNSMIIYWGQRINRDFALQKSCNFPPFRLALWVMYSLFSCFKNCLIDDKFGGRNSSLNMMVFFVRCLHLKKSSTDHDCIICSEYKSRMCTYVHVDAYDR